jgi:hypothetical protein
MTWPRFEPGTSHFTVWYSVHSPRSGFARPQDSTRINHCYDSANFMSSIRPFLAHLWWAIAMTWRPSSSSVSKARFVTAGAISMKWGNTPRDFLIFAIRPILWPPGGHLENTFAILGGVSSKTTSHITRVLDFTYFSRSQRSKFEKNYEVGVFCYYLT